MTKLKSAIGSPQFPIVVRLFFVAAILIVYFAGLTMPLVGPDEPRYAQVAREMFERGDWVTPTLGGFNWFEKPALLYWLEIASYNLFGVSEFAARFGSALFGLGTIFGLRILGKRVETTTTDQRSTNQFANWLALIAASTVGIIVFAHGASFDIVLTFPMTAALVSFFIYDLRSRSPWLVLFYFFIGLSLLAKGLVGIVFPFAIVSLYFVLSRKLPDRALILSLIWGTLLAVAVAGVWYVPMYLRHGYEFIDQFFIQHHFQRYTSNKYLHPQPFYFFFWVLPLMTIPWLPFFVAALARLGTSVVRRETEGNIADVQYPTSTSLSLFSISWIAVPLLFFSFSGSKLPGYILPAVPPAIILTADFIYSFVQKSRWRKYVIQAIALGTFVAVTVVMIVFVPRFAEAESVKSMFAAAADKGYGELPVVMLHRVSHNAEFYAPGRIMRDADAKPKKLFGPAEVLREIREGGRPILVLVPLEYLQQLHDCNGLTAEFIKDNGELALVLAKQTSSP